MSKFKRRTKIITKNGNEYVTELHASQVNYFIQYGNGFLQTEYINDTGHILSVVIEHGEIAEAVDLVRKKNPAVTPQLAKRLRMAGDGSVHPR